MNEIKQKRLEKRILQLVADLYFLELKNPKIGFSTFVKCNLSNDGSVAKIFVSIYEEEPKKQETLKALNRSAGFIKSRIAKVIRVKVIPNVVFILDHSIEEMSKLGSLTES